MGFGIGNGFFKPVPENIALDNSSPLFDNIVDNKVNLYVSTTGDDTNGDGSESNPYATPQRAANSIPLDVKQDTTVQIQCGSGVFDFPDVSRVPNQAQIKFIGDRSVSVISIPAGSTTFSAISGKKARWTGNVGSYTATINDGSHWRSMTSTFDGSVIAYNVAASTSPNLNIVTSFDLSGFFDQEVHPYTTYFQTVSGGVPSYIAPSEGSDANRTSSNITFMGIAIKNQLPYGSMVARGLAFSGCKFEKDPATSNFGVDLENCNFNSFAQNVNLTLSACYSFGAHTTLTNYTVEGVGLTICSGCVVSPVFVNFGSTLFYSSCDLEGSGTAIGLYGGSPHLILGNSTVDATLSSVVDFQCINGSLAASGQIIGSCTGNGFIIRNGGQATGVENSCNGNLTTGGSNIIVGGNAGQTFASLPSNDLAAATPQLCRAT